MPIPQISISFKEAASTAIQRGQRGIVALIIKDTTHNSSLLTFQPNDAIPSDLSAYNQQQIKFALMGGVYPPTKVIVYVEPAAAVDYTEAQTYLEGVKWDYLAVPGIVPADAATVSTWVKGLRDTKSKRVKAVLPNTAADHEGIINFTTDQIGSGGTTYATADYCARIAGVLAGQPLTMSVTYQVLSDVTSIPVQTDTQISADIDAGELVLMNDGEKIKIARGVNSLVTLTSDKGADFQKIKIVDTMDLIYGDIKGTANDNYIGKVPNNYDNKVLLNTAINVYLQELAAQNLLDVNMTNAVWVDVDATKTYLQGQGVDTSTLTDQQIKEYNTGDNDFIAGSIKILDAIEDIDLAMAI